MILEVILLFLVNLFLALHSRYLLDQTPPSFLYASLEDSLAILFTMFFFLLWAILLRLWPKFRFFLWGFFVFLIHIFYLMNNEYFHYYQEQFHFSELKAETLSWELFDSILSELSSWSFVKSFLLLVFWEILFFLSYWYLYQKKQYKNSINTLLYSLVFTLIFLSIAIFLRAYPINSQESQKNNFVLAKEWEKKKKASNFLVQLLWNQEASFLQENTLLPSYDYYNNQNLPFRFDTSSFLEESKRTKAISFVRKKYNIVLYLFESTAHSYLSKKIDDKYVTPSWQKFSENAIYFPKHYIGNPLSINALFTLLTSLSTPPGDFWPARDFPTMPIYTIAQTLKVFGYKSIFIHSGSLAYAGQRDFLKRCGFDILLEQKQIAKPPYDKNLNWGVDDRALISASRDFVSQLEEGKPYFMVISPLSPHHPYHIPEEKFAITKNKKQNSWNRYLNSLHYGDFVMGKIVNQLENMGNGENTVFFLLADHGEAFGQHPANFNHPFYLYEENVHVPFLIYNKKLFPKKITYPAISRHIDIMPSILDILGLYKRKKVRDQLGVPLLLGGKKQIATFYTSWRNQIGGLRDGNWKYIFNLRYGTEELYNLEKDPKERKNLQEKYPKLSQRYQDFLSRLFAYERKFYEKKLKREINWWKTFDKTNL